MSFWLKSIGVATSSSVIIRADGTREALPLQVNPILAPRFPRLEARYERIRTWLPF